MATWTFTLPPWCYVIQKPLFKVLKKALVFPKNSTSANSDQAQITTTLPVTVKIYTLSVEKKHILGVKWKRHHSSFIAQGFYSEGESKMCQHAPSFELLKAAFWRTKDFFWNISFGTLLCRSFNIFHWDKSWIYSPFWDVIITSRVNKQHKCLLSNHGLMMLHL